MDPVSLGIAAVGVGMQIYGSYKQYENAKEVAAVSQDVARQEQAINNAKMRQMELEGRRTQLQNVRNAQRARAQAVQAATTQGAQFGSGLQGGLAQIQDQMGWNMLGVDQALATGREINTYNNNISNDKQRLASLGADAAEAQGYSSLGGALIKSGPIVGQISQGFGGSGMQQSMANPYDAMPRATYNYGLA